MAPVILALRDSDEADVRVLATAQHRQLLDPILALFGISPDIDLDIMRKNQSLPELTARLIPALDAVLDRERPDAVVAQGDTTTVLTTALASFYRKIPFGHVEAGLRTGDLYTPFPEEMNRVLVSKLARWHFAPTEQARENLIREGIASRNIHVTGNTVIDALLQTAERQVPLGIPLPSDKKLILVTAHRRENFGTPFRAICRAIRTLADANDDVHFLYPVHLNPNVFDVAQSELTGHPRITLCEPLEYGSFITAMQRAHIILTDSGGVQEEAPALGVPALVLRTETERPEAVEAGVVELVGPVPDRIVSACERLLRDPDHYASMARGVSPYGDGHAAERIVKVLLG
jgi:UDP-N-acetylglucosamine 2-epimerase (non-hydrolysing)